MTRFLSRVEQTSEADAERVPPDGGWSVAGIAWHAHEMLWGFIATIAVGFLMTAGTSWTGINPLSGRALAAVLSLIHI